MIPSSTKLGHFIKRISFSTIFLNFWSSLVCRRICYWRRVLWTIGSPRCVGMGTQRWRAYWIQLFSNLDFWRLFWFRWSQLHCCWLARTFLTNDLISVVIRIFWSIRRKCSEIFLIYLSLNGQKPVLPQLSGDNNTVSTF